MEFKLQRGAEDVELLRQRESAQSAFDDGGERVGFGQIRELGNNGLWELASLYVEPAYRGRGVGKHDSAEESDTGPGVDRHRSSPKVRSLA